MTIIPGAGSGDNDNEPVEVRDRNGAVFKVPDDQRSCYYLRKAGAGAELSGDRPVVFVCKVAHGSYHRGCRAKGCLAR